MKKINIFLTFILIFGIWGTLSKSSAHRVNIFCWVEGQKIYCESKYPSGEKVKKGTVNIKDLTTGKIIASKTTDNKGKVDFDLPKQVFTNKHDLEAEILAGMGHRNTWKIPFKELQEQNDIKTPSATSKTSTSSSSVLPWDTTIPANSKNLSANSPSCEEIEQIIDKVLTKRLNPIMEKLTLLQEKKITLQDIFSGIGYIFGLMGIALYFMSKNKNE
ncbi:nickel transport protein [Desulfonauticus submarinus]|uniref:Nickel transport protein n=1 Tax=Desulfonauticus submarinus TaxID=206665 RepID=A0A1H0E7Q7_9BACT|nr:hypothetical protein [Desulfonauticus submarinus]SDN78395.1 nickel transport protein [Desulfonauticus submarinus]